MKHTRILVTVLLFLAFAAGVGVQHLRVSAQDNATVVNIPKEWGDLKAFTMINTGNAAVFQDSAGTVRVVRVAPAAFGQGVLELEIRRK